MFAGEASVHIDASPDEVYALVSDVTRMREWSPECQRCAWLDGADGPAVGVRFRGWNKAKFLRWSRLVEVAAADPGREFTFVTQRDFVNKDSTIWRYQMETDAEGTKLTESYEVLQIPTIPIRFVSWLARRPHDMVPHMEQTLGRIKQAAESPNGDGH